MLKYLKNINKQTLEIFSTASSREKAHFQVFVSCILQSPGPETEVTLCGQK